MMRKRVYIHEGCKSCSELTAHLAETHGQDGFPGRPARPVVSPEDLASLEQRLEERMTKAIKAAVAAVAPPKPEPQRVPDSVDDIFAQPRPGRADEAPWR